MPQAEVCLESNRGNIKHLTLARYNQPEILPKIETSLMAVAVGNYTRQADSSRLRGVSWRSQKVARLGA